MKDNKYGIIDVGDDNVEKVQFENKHFVLYSPDSLKYITDNMNDILIGSFNFYKELFDINSFRKFQINYFDDIEEFRNYIYDLRGEKESLPKYAKGTFDNGMVNSYISPNIDVNSTQYHKTLYMASHELFHIMYQELIWGKEKIDRIVWFDEGMAQLFSGENDYNLSEDNFDNWFNYVLNKTYEIPNLNELKHGSSFENEKYSGYNLSLLSVKYLYETLGQDEFKKLMHDNDRIIEYGKTIAQDAIHYYKNELKNRRNSVTKK